MSLRTPPRSTPAVVPAALVVALLLVDVAAVAVRDLVVSQGWSNGTPWVSSLVGSLDGLTASVGVLVAAGVAVVVGLLLVWLALKPARRTHLRGRAEADLWLTPSALAALARSTADRSAGVLSAETPKVGRRRIVVEVTTRRDASSVTQQVEAALTEHVRGLTDTTITVRATQLDTPRTPEAGAPAAADPTTTATATTDSKEAVR